MILDFLKPVENKFLETISSYSDRTLAHTVTIHSEEKGIPDLKDVHIAIFGVQEGRTAVNNISTGCDINAIRIHFYRLYPGNWSTNIVDLGDIHQGKTVNDTYFAVKEVVSSLIEKDIISVIVGGSQDLTYANYMAYNNLNQIVNLVSVDSKFDLGKLEAPLDSRSYLSKIIMKESSNLLNFSNIGYQTFFNSQEEIDLLESLSFDIYRLGEAKNLELLEPVIRGADIMSIDIGAIRKSEAPANKNATPNGFYGDEICKISRYAGISDKLTSFGIYEFNNDFDNQGQTAHLISQMIWYFIEGFCFRAKEYPYNAKKKYLKYIVPIKDMTIHFYKSPISGRWWMEIYSIKNNKQKRRALVPCTYQDYLDAASQNVPERWYKAFNRLN